MKNARCIELNCLVPVIQRQVEMVLWSCSELLQFFATAAAAAYQRWC